MVKIKKSIGFLKHFVTFLTFLFFLNSCTSHYSVIAIQGKQININQNYAQDTVIEKYIAPYRKHIDQDLQTVLAFCPETLDKSTGKWQTTIGNLIATVTLNKCNTVFKQQKNQTIDCCILNHGGIRSILPKGPVTTRNAFEIMPFENSAFVVALKGEQLAEFANYFVVGKKPHPIAGITFTITNTNQVKDIKINNIPLVLDQTYNVVTTDYLATGGDNMLFFKKGSTPIDINYKLRNILIDYFKDVETIDIINDIRVTQEN